MNKLLLMIAALLFSVGATAQVPEPFGPGGECSDAAIALAKILHGEKFGNQDEPMKLTVNYERSLGEFGAGSTKYQIFFVGGTDEVDGGYWVIAYSVSVSGECTYEQSFFLDY